MQRIARAATAQGSVGVSMRRPILLTILCLALLWCAAAHQPAAAQAAPSQNPNAGLQDAAPSFSQWLDGVRAEALARGIRQEIIDQALGDIPEPVTDSIERDRSQPET